MPKAVVKRVEWEDLRTGMRISLQKRSGNRKIGSEFCGFVMDKDEDEVKVLFDNKTSSVWVSRQYVDKGWIRFDPRRL